MTLDQEKKQLRDAMRAARKAASPEQRDEWSRAACARISELPQYRRAQCLLCYMAMAAECDPAALVADARQREKQVAFPVCEADFGLGLYVPRDADGFVVGKYGILTPDLSRAERVSPEDVDCMIIPGVAFDGCGNRLGQGAGYYDRLLSKTKAYKIGLAFPIQMVASVPVDALDCPMDAIACADSVYFPGA